MKLVFDFIFASLIVLITLTIYFLALQNLSGGVTKLSNYESSELLSLLCKDIYFVNTVSKYCNSICSGSIISRNYIVRMLKPYVNSYLSQFRYFITIECYCRNNSVKKLVSFGDIYTTGLSSSIIIPSITYDSNVSYIKIYLRIET